MTHRQRHVPGKYSLGYFQNFQLECPPFVLQKLTDSSLPCSVTQNHSMFLLSTWGRNYRAYNINQIKINFRLFYGKEQAYYDCHRRKSGLQDATRWTMLHKLT